VEPATPPGSWTAVIPGPKIQDRNDTKTTDSGSLQTHEKSGPAGQPAKSGSALCLQGIQANACSGLSEPVTAALSNSYARERQYCKLRLLGLFGWGAR
jgi:hypothetical protein